MRFEGRWRTRDGDYRWLSWTAVPEENLIYTVARDITDDKQRAAELESAQDQLRQSQKMEAIGQLTGGIAHDFNNLLGAVVGSLDLIRRKATDAERVRRFAEAGTSGSRTRCEADRAASRVSRAQRIEMVPIVVSDLLLGMQDLLARTLGPMVRLTLQLDEEKATVLSDPTQIEMAILNLAINARDAMVDGGALTISTSVRRSNRNPADLLSGERVEFAVSDTGVGMLPDVARRAFDPFFTTKGIGKGTGLRSAKSTRSSVNPVGGWISKAALAWARPCAWSCRVQQFSPPRCARPSRPS